MGDAAVKLKQPEPDLKIGEAIRMRYWKLPNGQHFGSLVDNMVQVGTAISDGIATSGVVDEILHYPSSGTTVVRVRPGSGPGLTADDIAALPKKYLVACGGQGATL